MRDRATLPRMGRFLFWWLVTYLGFTVAFILIGFDYLNTVSKGRAIAIILALSLVNILGYAQGRIRSTEQ